MNRILATPLCVLAAMLCAVALAGCAEPEPPITLVPDGDPLRGRALMAQLQCGACHQVPGLRSARGQVGPSLAGFARRIYLAGKWPNEPDYLLRWLRDPPAIAPLTAMPALVRHDADARDIAAYLYTLD